MKYGKIFVDDEINCLNVHWEDGSYGEGYHCGDIINVRIPAIGEWEWYRIEFDHEQKAWYFVGLLKEYGNLPVGTETRIY